MCEGREKKDGAKMGPAPSHISALEELERECLLGLVNVLREEGLEAVRYFPSDKTGWHRHPCPGIKGSSSASAWPLRKVLTQ